MTKEVCIKNYKGHRLIIYASEDKLWWQTTIYESSFPNNVAPLSFTTPKVFLTKEKAMEDGKKFIDDFVLAESLE